MWTMRELIGKWCISRWIARMLNDDPDPVEVGRSSILEKLEEVDLVRKKNRKQVDALMRQLAKSLNEGVLHKGIQSEIRRIASIRDNDNDEG